MLERVVRTIEAHAMVSPGDTVVLAVSGGADSMALLHLFLSLREAWRLRLHVAHLDHGLRPDSAQDAAFVREAAVSLAVPVTVGGADVRAFALRQRRSVEDAGRALRYAFLADVARAVGARVVATAHTRDDQIETILMRLVQGARWEALAGIPPTRPLGAATVVRPLREVSREEIVAFLRARDLPWREDPTNRDLRIPRNRIRHVVLPELLRACPDAAALLWDVGEAARRTDIAMHRLAAVHYGYLRRWEERTVRLPREAFRALPAPLRRRVLAAALAEVSGTAPPPFRVVAEGLRRAEQGAVGSETSAAGVVVRVGYGTIEVAPAERPRPAEAYLLPVPGEVRAEEFGVIVSATLAPAGDGPQAGVEAVFDAASLALPLRIRAWRDGDRIVLPGLGGEKKVQDLFVDAKVPRWRRRRVALVVDGHDHILWVVGYRTSACHPVTERTTTVVRLQARPA
ncbi:MAG: tRNA lysidine(34) synthetase TilS [Armatimonadota bacterium]|nr:tRNA lysidine(34) synthetase TilS [Armatimonadota bacterium]MDR7451599.1 tRNA lysidine(34) synthetase TilS [Armatimonadota bacterium]MDR7467681.1 tRNA lysidine(34) synthetase TilS [Armatimonadota bacterium]MDR7492568.1 tRNA lysidine(34) synthetase TilS [Armatimonadota bacterium]MDR7499964.1 tRNA lysidine(34) synthetase TilS [Armatimonadota bacterium]